MAVSEREELLTAEVSSENHFTHGRIPEFAKGISRQVLFIGTGIAASHGTTAASILVGFEASSKVGMLSNPQDLRAKAIFAGAVLFNYATNVKGNFQNVSLLEDQNIGACGNIPQTAVNKLCKFVAPQLHKTRKVATSVAGFSQNIIEDALWAQGLLHYSGGLTALTTKELLAGAGGTIWIAGMALIKKRFGETDVFNASHHPTEPIGELKFVRGKH